MKFHIFHTALNVNDKIVVMHWNTRFLIDQRYCDGTAIEI